jgi:hypothetical protein
MKKFKMFLLKLITGKDIVVINAEVRGILYIDNTEGKEPYIHNVRVINN